MVSTTGTTMGADGFPVDPQGLYTEQQIAINPIIEQALRSPHSWEVKIRSYPSMQALLQQNVLFQVKTIFAIFERLNWLQREVLPRSHSQEHLRKTLRALEELLNILLQRKLPYTETDILGIVRWCVVDYYEAVYKLTEQHAFILPRVKILRCIENYAQKHSLSADLLQYLRSLPDIGLNKPERVIYDRILAKKSETVDLRKLLEMGVGEPWVDAVVQEIEALPPAQQQPWYKLLLHTSTATQSAPTQKWLGQAQPLLQAVNNAEFKHAVCRWFTLVDQSTKAAHLIRSSHDYIAEKNRLVLTGLVWCCSLVQDDDVLVAIADLTITCFKKIPEVGPLCAKAGNAGLWLLSENGTAVAIDCIEKLRHKVKHKSVQKQIEKAFNRAAEKAGLSRQDLEELAIPTYNLDATGIFHQTLGNFTATIQILGTQQVELTWLKSDGKPQKSIPAEVKQNFATELKALKRTVEDIKKTLVAQRDRLESLYLTPRSWNFEVWRDRYLKHPLLAHLSQRLIWSFQNPERTQLCIWQNGQFVDSHGEALVDPSDRDQVTLWHPIQASAETVLAWRQWLETHTVVQPFKQAHREVYLLTDAERQTRTYSNRFAAHIIRQHQFASLCKQRGWQYSLQGTFDSHNIPTWNLPQSDLQVQFWVDPASHETAASHIYLYVSTDQVRFCDAQSNTPLVLETIPALIFSEVMRTVDLFVGVCSIGNDPTWQDRGEGEAYGDYWHNYSFGELSTAAQVRRELLARLLPKLKIRDRCTLGDRFLTIQGDLKTYKIHLGSGNILMEPGSRYLCIVPDKSASAQEQVFLPFEGDLMLSSILSKAFLLADDRTIKDPTILHQIR